MGTLLLEIFINPHQVMSYDDPLVTLIPSIQTTPVSIASWSLSLCSRPWELQVGTTKPPKVAILQPGMMTSLRVEDLAQSTMLVMVMGGAFFHCVCLNFAVQLRL